MFKLILKQFVKHWKIWLSVAPIFLVSGLIFSTALTILNGVSNLNIQSEGDYGTFMQMPIIIGGVVLLLLTKNAMKQCVDMFDETNDILLLLGASPLQLSIVMTGQMLLIGLIGAIIGTLFSIPTTQGFFSILPSNAGRDYFSQISLQFSCRIVCITLLIQSALITLTCMRYCLKNYQQRKGSLSSHSHVQTKKFMVGLSGS